MEPGETKAIYDVDEEHEARARRQMAEANRRQFPVVAGLVDEFRKIFGDGVKVVYFRENGEERGERPDPANGVTLDKVGSSAPMNVDLKAAHMRSTPPKHKR